MKKLATLFVLLMLVVAAGMTSAAGVPVFNGDFETLPAGVNEATALTISPLGWVGTGGGQLWSMQLTNEKVFAGKYALKVQAEPGNTPFGVHVSSKPIPVQPGKTYTATFKALNVIEPPYNGSVDLYMEFWPEGGWWGETDYWSADSAINKLKGAWLGKTRLGVKFSGSTAGDWVDVTTSGVAPDNAKYVTIALWTSKRVEKTYVDNVQLTEE